MAHTTASERMFYNSLQVAYKKELYISWKKKRKGNTN